MKTILYKIQIVIEAMADDTNYFACENNARYCIYCRNWISYYHNQVHKEDCPVQIAKELRAMEYKQ